MVRETIGVMLNYLHKDIRILMDLLAKNNMYYESLFSYEKRTLDRYPQDVPSGGNAQVKDSILVQTAY